MKWKVYEYHWMDHYYDNSWGLLDPNRMKPQVITGVGVKVGEDKEYVYFTQGIQADGVNYNGAMAVMKKNILYMNVIAKLNTKKYRT